MTADEYGYLGSRYEPVEPETATGVPSAPICRADPDPRLTVTWEGEGQPIVVTNYARGGRIEVSLSPRRALEVAQMLIDRALREGDFDD